MERHADPIDLANDLAEREREAVRQLRQPVPKATGRCAYCREPTPGVYCDGDCEEGHRKERWALAQRPRGRGV